MKISTNLFFDRASQQMVKGQEELSKVQVQLASGKKVNNPSDEPARASSIQRMLTLVEQQESYTNNIRSVAERLQAQEVSLRGVSDLMQRMRELAVQYTNGTLSGDQRRIAAIEVRGIRDQIHTLANAVDANGRSLFAGASVATPAFDEHGRYQGDQTDTGVPVGSSRLINSRRAGDEVFASIARQSSGGIPTAVGFFTVIDQFATALENNQVDDARRSIDELALVHQGINLAQADIGADLKLAESQESSLREQLLQSKSILSDLRDLDYAEAVTQMQKRMMALEAAQSSFAKISGLSLFQYL